MSYKVKLEVFEGPLVTIKKRFQGATVNELKIHGPAKAQHQQKQLEV